MKSYNEEKYADLERIKERLKDLRVGRDVLENPHVSVIIPAFEIAEFVEETLNSVFAQTFQNFEVILVNDGSPDTEKLEKLLAPYFDRIVYARQENLGASRARNAAIALARGTWLAFLDGDDVWLPEFLASQVSFADENAFEMVYCDALLFGEPLFEGENYMKTSPSNGRVTTESLISADCNVITSGTILKKKWVERVNLFDISLPRMQDFDLWYRVAKHGASIGYQKKILIKYRVRPNSLSGSNVERSRRNIRALEVIREKYGLNDSEKTAWENKLKEYEAEYELEQGKFHLTNGEFAEARRHLQAANLFYRKPKLALITALMKISPRLTLRLFKKFRPAEFSFIAPNKS